MSVSSPRPLRRAYVEWVEQKIEDFKERIPRSDLLDLADEVVTELRVSAKGQYQLTELLLCNAIDRRIGRMLKLPGYRAWCAARRAEAEAQQTLIAFPLPDRLRVLAPEPAAAPEPASVAADTALAEEPLACVV